MIVVMRRNAADTEPLASGLDGRCMRERWRSFLPQMWKLRLSGSQLLQTVASSEHCWSSQFSIRVDSHNQTNFRFEHFATKLLHLQDVKMKFPLSINSRGWSARSVRWPEKDDQVGYRRRVFCATRVVDPSRSSHRRKLVVSFLLI